MIASLTTISPELAWPGVASGGVDRGDGVGLLDGVAWWQERRCSCADCHAEALDLQLVLVHPLEAALDGLVVALDLDYCLIRPRREGARNQQTALVADDFGEVVARRKEVSVDQGKLSLAEIQRDGDATLDLASRWDHYLRSS